MCLFEKKKNYIIFFISSFAASNLGRARRDANQYTIEVAVAVDKEMMEYYGDELGYVVLTAMNLTSDVYENSNLKQAISISVTQLIQLPFDTSEFEDAPGTDGKNAQKMLTKFCDYVKSTTLKYDAAILLTRYIILRLVFLQNEYSVENYEEEVCFLERKKKQMKTQKREHVVVDLKITKVNQVVQLHICVLINHTFF